MVKLLHHQSIIEPVLYDKHGNTRRKSLAIGRFRDVHFSALSFSSCFSVFVVYSWPYPLFKQVLTHQECDLG
ncbi:MAG: hypothetical protein ACH350_02985 [Parachlamydiaceae bacterium]